MSHDYLYRRHQSSRLAAQSWEFPTTTPGLPEEPVTTPGTPQFPDRAPGPRRAAAVAYLILATFVKPAVAEVPVELQSHLFPDSTRVRQARTHEAYYRFFSQKTGGADFLGEELRRKELPEAAPGPRRAANTAYWFPSRLEDLFAEILETPVELQRRDVSERAPGPSRTANDAYWIPSRLTDFFAVVAELPVELQRQDFPEVARRKRSDAHFRFFSIKAGGPELIELEQRRREFPEAAPGPRRAANTAYWFPSRQEDLFAEVIPVEVFRRELPEIARGAPRAAAQAYWIDQTRLAIEVVEVPLELQRRHLPERAPSPQRAANDAYWIDPNRLIIEVVGELPVELQTRIFPDIPRRRHTTQDAYFRYFSIVSGFDDALPEGQILQDIWLLPDQAPGPRRAASTAYWFPSRLEDLFAEIPPVVVRRKELRRGWYRTFRT